MSANRFVLKHHQIEVDYTIGITPGLPALIYKNGSNVKTFTANQITTDQTALGSMVSVALVTTVDTGGERFGFFLPELDVAKGHTEKFTTVGVYEKFGGPASFPHLPPAWRCIDMHGTAQTVIVPVVEHATA